jgi:NAD(P)-dependent dehydrogenase (short-subunit alcohol dehydrogenase family)
MNRVWLITGANSGFGWDATGITFRAWHSRGDESVRTHLLSS